MVKTAEKKPIDFKAVYDGAEKHRIELEEKLKVKIKMAVLCAGEDVEPCICYFRPATTMTKMACRDLMYTSPSRAAERLFDATIIREESDKRVFQKDNDQDVFYIGAIDWCADQVTQASVYVKKK